MKKGFTLTELILVLVLLPVLAAMAIPAYQNIATRSRDEVTRAALAQFRSGIDRYESDLILAGTGNINTPPHPNMCQIEDSECTVFDSTCDGMSWPLTPKVMPNGENPENPWMAQKTCSTRRPEQADWVYGASCLAVGTVITSATYCNYGWIYCPTTGVIWANSNVNGENAF